MKIFNKEIFGSDADQWLELSSCDKLKWIKANTNQQSDEIIKDFIKVATKGKDCKCLDCGKNEHISKTNATEVANSVEPSVVTKPSKRNGTKRSKKS